MSYDGEYVARHIGKISVLGVRFLLLMPPVGHIQYSKCSANLHWIRVVVIEIWINLPPVFGASDGEFKWSLVCVKKCAACALHPGVVSATLLGVRYSVLWLDKSYGSISKIDFIRLKPPGVSARMWSVNLDASISEEYQTLEGHSCWDSE
jgi:hypothetical protein